MSHTDRRQKKPRNVWLCNKREKCELIAKSLYTLNPYPAETESD